ncbi:MAG TPA: ATP-dependent DNA helicase [Firmicutes bacterium]|nr:ATP-dependent DNA helicase [Bacillota bacterium]
MIIKKGVKDIVGYVYQQGDLNTEYFQANRAQYGTQAHQRIQKTYHDDECEVFIEETIKYLGHDITLSGRMDLLLQTDSELIIGEIKSTTRKLENIKENDRPAHYAQAKFYAYMLLKQRPEVSSVVVRMIYCDLEGKQQRTFDHTYTLEILEPFVLETLEIYIDWYLILIDSMKKKLKTAKTLTFPFGDFRQYQRELSGSVYQCIKTKKNLLLRAPTGIGKTMGTIFPSIKALSDEEQKIFYLTAKTMGRSVAEKAFKICHDRGFHAKVTTITAKEKICFMEEVKCDPTYCPYALGYFDRVNEATKDLFVNHSIFDRETIATYAKKHEVCPFEFSLGMASVSDAIIGDYNYMFDPRAYLRRFFDEPSNHIALIDEAHNLYDRACSMYSATLMKEPISELKRVFKDRHKELAKALSNFDMKFIEYRRELQEGNHKDLFKLDLDRAFLNRAEDLLDVTEKYLYQYPDTEYKPQLMTLYFDLFQFLRIADFFNEQFRARYERFGADVRVSIVCLNPSQYLVEKMEQVRSTILFSATLHPLDYYQTVLLNDEDCEQIFLPTPFERKHLELIVHRGISTKYRAREYSLQHLVQSIYEITRKQVGNYLVFFPSYQYLEMVYDAYEQRVGQTQKLLVQEREMDEVAREQFLDQFVSQPTQTLVGFTVLGGIFGEGIDLIGDRLIGSIIVGVGLPQINPLTEQRRQYFEDKFAKGYLYAYVYPGFNKVMQAVGRVIRTEHDKGMVMLMDERYVEQTYLELFPYEWQHAKFIGHINEIRK